MVCYGRICFPGHGGQPDALVQLNVAVLDEANFPWLSYVGSCCWPDIEL
jgi:hypothetical protein